MTSRCIFKKYHALEQRIEREMETTMDSEQYKKLSALQLKCFPSKEQVIEWGLAFFQEGN